MDAEKIAALRVTDYFGQTLGATMEEVSGERAVYRMPIQQMHMNPGDTVHGGVLFTLCDMTAGSAAHAFGNYTTTTDANIHYLRAVKDLDEIICEATLLKGGKSLLIYDAKIKDYAGTIYATATLSYFNLGIPIEEKGE